MAHPEAPVQVLKITGLGRSGSTILDVVLGNHPKIESVGEVGNLMRNGWISHKSLRGIPEKASAFRSAPAANGWMSSTSTLLRRPARSGPGCGASGWSG